MNLETASKIRRIPTHMLRHYPGPLQGRKYAQLEARCRELRIRPTWADIESERGRRGIK